MDLDRVTEGERLKGNIDFLVGTPIALSIEGLGEELTSSFVGFEEDGYLLVRGPKLGRMKRLLAGKRASIRYIHSGTFFGFDCQIIGHVSKPVPLVVLTYPTAVSRRGLRARPRTNCCLSASLSKGEDDYHGLLINISASGCRFVWRREENPDLPEISVGDKVVAAFSLTAESGVLSVPSVVRNTRPEEALGIIGLSFDRPAAAGQLESIESFVRLALRHAVGRMQELHRLA